MITVQGPDSEKGRSKTDLRKPLRSDDPAAQRNRRTLTQDAGLSREERLNQMMLTYEREVLRLCCLYLHDAGLAQDAVQETFLKAYRRLDAFEGRASERTWLMRIAVNTCRDMCRSGWFRHVDRAVPLDDLYTGDRLPPPVAPPSAEHIALTAAIMGLPQKQREVILLHCDQGLTVRDTARALGITAPAVMNRLKKARAELARVLEVEDA